MIENDSDDVVEWKKEPVLTNEIDVQTILVETQENSTITTEV